MNLLGDRAPGWVDKAGETYDRVSDAAYKGLRVVSRALMGIFCVLAVAGSLLWANTAQPNTIEGVLDEHFDDRAGYVEDDNARRLRKLAPALWKDVTTDDAIGAAGELCDGLGRTEEVSEPSAAALVNVLHETFPAAAGDRDATRKIATQLTDYFCQQNIDRARDAFPAARRNS